MIPAFRWLNGHPPVVSPEVVTKGLLVRLQNLHLSFHPIIILRKIVDRFSQLLVGQTQSNQPVPLCRNLYVCRDVRSAYLFRMTQGVEYPWHVTLRTPHPKEVVGQAP